MSEAREPEFFEDRVRRGAAWMDENAPMNWRDKVNLQTFVMTSPCMCVLGQVFGNYWDVAGDRKPVGWAINHGFMLDDDPNLSVDDAELEWDNLERAWVKYLKEVQP